MRICTKCFKELSIELFYFRTTENRYSSWCKQCFYQAQNLRWINRKRKVVELMGGECQTLDCGYKRNLAALQLHHLDPSQKDADWSVMKEWSWKRLIEEVKKCILLCSNCHAEIHNPGLTVGTSAGVMLLNGLSSTGTCICGELVYGSKYCSPTCSSLSQRKVLRPSRTELMQTLEHNSMVKTGELYGVTDKTIKKWINFYGIN